MARMYSRKKGKSGSKKPLVDKKPEWQRYGETEIELLVVKLAKQGMAASQIGLQLRDTYGIPNVKLTCKKSITQILKEKDAAPELPEDLLNLMKRCVLIRKHLDAHKQDQTANRGIQLTTSKLLRLVKYYKSIGRLPEDWKFDPDKLKLFVE
jgi:small subunit ribosomal protein S15